jgi:hypothetical protein
MYYKLRLRPEVVIGLLDGKLHHVEEKIGLRVEEEEGAVVDVVGKKIVKKPVASIEDHAHSDNLKKRMILVFQNGAYITRRETTSPE